MMEWVMATLGIDFGTSNTAAAVARGGVPEVLALEGGARTLPTAVFLDFAERRTLYGNAAASAMMDGLEGRFMRALKSVLGTSLAREKRQFLNERMTLIEVIARFLSEIKTRAEAVTGERYEGAVSGRPVLFHSADAARNAQALADLTEAYRLAGFERLDFLPEPEAAALAAGGTGRGVIVDIGGGTSDFTVFEREGVRFDVLASHGVRLGGTDFDKALSVAHVMPLFGMGAALRDSFGKGTLPAPKALYHELASWEKIAFVYGAERLREVRGWERQALEPQLFARLGDVLESHLGHDVAYAVEAGKIAANGDALGQIELGVVERGLAAALAPEVMAGDLAGYAPELEGALRQTLADAGGAPVERVIFVGGSSLMRVVRDVVSDVLPDAAQETSEVFTAVADGLAIAAERVDRGEAVALYPAYS